MILKSIPMADTPVLSVYDLRDRLIALNNERKQLIEKLNEREDTLMTRNYLKKPKYRLFRDMISKIYTRRDTKYFTKYQYLPDTKLDANFIPFHDHITFEFIGGEKMVFKIDSYCGCNDSEIEYSVDEEDAEDYINSITRAKLIQIFESHHIDPTIKNIQKFLHLVEEISTKNLFSKSFTTMIASDDQYDAEDSVF